MKYMHQIEFYDADFIGHTFSIINLIAQVVGIGLSTRFSMSTIAFISVTSQIHNGHISAPSEK